MCSAKISSINQVDLSKTPNKKVISEQKQETKTVKDGKKFILAGLAAASALGIATVLILKNKANQATQAVAETLISDLNFDKAGVAKKGEDLFTGTANYLNKNGDKFKIEYDNGKLIRSTMNKNDDGTVNFARNFVKEYVYDEKGVLKGIKKQEVVCDGVLEDYIDLEQNRVSAVKNKIMNLLGKTQKEIDETVKNIEQLPKSVEEKAQEALNLFLKPTSDVNIKDFNPEEIEADEINKIFKKFIPEKTVDIYDHSAEDILKKTKKVMEYSKDGKKIRAFFTDNNKLLLLEETLADTKKKNLYFHPFNLAEELGFPTGTFFAENFKFNENDFSCSKLLYSLGEERKYYENCSQKNVGKELEVGNFGLLNVKKYRKNKDFSSGKSETAVLDFKNGKIRSMRDNFDKIKVQHSEQALSRRELGCRDVEATINGKDFGFDIENPPFRSLK